MATKKYLTIVLRKEVTDIPTAEQMYELVKQRMADNPDVTINGSVGVQFTDE